MKVCGVELKGSEAILCLMSLEQGLFEIPDCRTTRLAISKSTTTEEVRKFQFAFAKLMEDYKVSHVVIKERITKGKFAGGAVSFKLEATIQLIESLGVDLISATEIKETIKRHPMPVDFKATGLKQFQEHAFAAAYAYLVR
ncbi:MULTISPECIES: DUF3010 family protein [Corallincola]|uniref:DUF3010 family protein n=2 Tax=Corallincola TaxID=1775176 RepID=A0A368NNX0_9GAMM|nr:MULTISPECIES: DUF3010 family protein [Corallincola]RCU51555.1 DUF3010 family protein [Corallincola holothuriorum]TAA47058.1 DUF3010 family protein [Corallincola spongiicola]